MDREVFVQNIEKYCAQNGVKPTNACRDSGVGASFVTDIKRGQTPSVAKVQLLAQYLGCTVSDLLGEKATSSPPSEDDELLQKISALAPERRKQAEEYLDFLITQQGNQ
jgi:DNA-binding helix-turn-helix protein|nr:MAG TPA: Repressor protein CI [Bacteriophage sp.]